MRKFNKKGFTLIELLAVIIILGVLLLIAIPAMNTLVENAKKDAFVSTAKNYISQARYEALQGEYELPGLGKYNVVPIQNIELEKGSKNSVYDKAWKDNLAYVVIVNEGSIDATTGEAKDKFVYYFAAVDVANNGIALTEENTMERDDVKKQGIKDGDIDTYSESAGIGSLSLNGKTYTYVG